MAYRFYFDDRLAGEFFNKFPRRPAVYGYMPLGSVREVMQRSLLETGAAECYYDDEEGRVFFTVVGCILNSVTINDFYRVRSQSSQE